MGENQNYRPLKIVARLQDCGTWYHVLLMISPVILAFKLPYVTDILHHTFKTQVNQKKNLEVRKFTGWLNTKFVM